MNNFEEYSLIVSIVALLCSFLSLYFSFRKLKISKYSLEKAENAEKISYANLKADLRSKISNSRNLVENAISKYAEVKKVEPIDKQLLEEKKRLIDSRMENFLNSYETLCFTYFKGGLNKEDLKEEYRDEIRDLIEKESLKKYFNPVTSRYQFMLKAYKEWENKIK